MLRLSLLWAVAALVALTAAAPTRLTSRAISSDVLQQLNLFAEYSAASYCTNNLNSTGTKLTCAAGNCPTVEKAETNTLYEFSQTSEYGDVAGFLAVDTTNKLLVLSFRGTRSVDTWIANLDFAQEDINNVCNGCSAHGGWWKSWQSVVDVLPSKIEAAVADYPDYKLVFTGHSFGGALAILGGTALRNAGYTIDLYPFGAPRVGNEKLAEYITGQGTLYRITHTNDAVPKLPPGNWGYSHPAPEYWITSDNDATVTTGDIEVIRETNSTAGNAGSLGASVLAHLAYFVDISASISPEKRDLIFVSNRLPYSVDDENGLLHASASSSDLVKALSDNLSTKPTNFRWFGWSGLNTQDPNEKKSFSDALAKHNAVGVFLDEQLAYDYYHRFSHCILWPVLHYQADVDFDENAWKSYVRVNEIFADTIAEEAVDGNLIWVHDYHLLLLPKLLRGCLENRGKRCVIGFTWHTPLPGDDFWKALPVKKELLDGVLAADVVGFHTEEYKRNFTKTCSSILGARSENAGQIMYNEHLTLINTFLLGIDPQIFNDAIQDPYVQERIKVLEDRFKDTTVMIGIDRLDHTKRMTQKLQGYDYFLDEHAELKGRVTLVQVAIPSQDYGDDYQELEMDIGSLARKINEKHGTHDWSPLIYMHHSFTFTELTALYCISDICMLASRRGGMNLVATEYVACREKKHGVLVLSECSGAISFLNAGSVTFGPSNMQEISNALHNAVTMDEDEREERYRYLRTYASKHTSAKCGQAFIDALANRANSSS